MTETNFIHIKKNHETGEVYYLDLCDGIHQSEWCELIIAIDTKREKSIAIKTRDYYRIVDIVKNYVGNSNKELYSIIREEFTALCDIYIDKEDVMTYNEIKEECDWRFIHDYCRKGEHTCRG